MNKTDRLSDENEAQLAYTKAARAEHSREYDLAYRLYVRSAELYLHLGRSGQGAESEGRKANAEKAIQRAEKIKAFIENSNTMKKSSSSSSSGGAGLSGAKNIITPVGIDHFSKQEQAYILKRGALVNGRAFPSWDEPPTLAGVRESLYVDPDGQPALSSQQAQVSPVWRRPPTLSAGPSRQILPQEILQYIVADCSVCASISVCLEHSRRFGSNLAQAAVHTLLNPSRSQSEGESPILGRYDVKIFFNGTWRRIAIDDMLPYNPLSGTLMCMSVFGSGNAPPPVWPSILEKGYMKLMGGYDFPGSNSSIDLHAIIGWVPEHLEFKGSNFEQEKCWHRILEGFHKGHCVLTLGTGANPRACWPGLNLIPSHNYAVIDVKEEEGTRVLTILDMWYSASLPDHLARQPSKAHQIPWRDATNIFDGIYISWDPSRWPSVLVHHGRWRRQAEDHSTPTRQISLQFRNSDTASKQEIWVLLTRHITNTTQGSEFISLKAELEDDAGGVPTTVDRATIAEKGNYTNSAHVLVKTTLPESQPSGMLSIFTSYDGDLPEVGFTLTVYAGMDVSLAWDEKVQKPPYVKRIDGVLTGKNSGGSWTHPTFMLNPQYHLHFYPTRKCQESGPAQADMTITLQTSRDIPVNVSLGWSQGERMFDLAAKDVVATSGAYFYGLARLSLSRTLSTRDYTVVVSAFEPQLLGDFSLCVESSQPFDIKVIPQEGAGMYTKLARGSWNASNAAGGPTSTRYSKNPVFEIDVPSLTQAKVRLQLLHPSPATSLNLTLFPSSSDGSLRRHITTSGAYSDAICGVVTPQVALNPGKYWAVPSTYNAGVEAGFQLYLYTTVQGVKIMERVAARI